MTGQGNKFKSILAKLLVLMMTINLLQGMVSMPVVAEEDYEYTLQGDNPVVLEQDGITYKRQVTKKENGVFEVITSFTGSQTETTQLKPTDVVLVIDTSGSMSSYRRMETARQAAKNFAKGLLAKNTAQHPDLFRVGVVSFDHYAKKNIDLTKNYSDVETAINSLTADGATYTQDGLMLGNSLFSSNRQKVMILISDGEPTYAYDANASDPEFAHHENHQADSDTPKPGFAIYYKKFLGGWGAGHRGGIWKNRNWYIKLLNRIGDGQQMTTVIKERTLTEAQKAKDNQVNILAIGIGMDSDEGKAVMNGIASSGTYSEAGNEGQDLDKILKSIQETLINKRVSDGVVTEKANLQFDVIGGKAIVTGQKTNGTNEEKEKFQQMVAAIANSFDSASNTFQLSNFSLGAEETLTFTYQIKFNQTGQENTWYSINSETELKLNQNETLKFANPLKIKYTRSQITVELIKKWVGDLIPDGQTVIVDIKDSDSGEIAATLELSKDTNWQKEINVPKFKNGAEIVYSAVERAIANYEQVGQPKIDKTNDKITFTITNKNVEKRLIVVTKKWLGTMPEMLELEVYQNDQKFERTMTITDVSGSGNIDSNWKGFYTEQVRKYDDEGKPYIYKVKEIGLDRTIYQADNGGEVIMTETFDPDFKQLVLAGTLTNRNIETIARTVKKEWKGDPKAVEVTLTGKVGDVTVHEETQTIPAEHNAQITFTAPKYDSLKRSDGSEPTGQEISYQVAEVEGTGYKQIDKQENGNEVTFVNHNTEEKKITITKEWENTPQVLIDQAQVKVQLNRQSGNGQPQELTVITLNKNDYDQAQEKFVKEVSVPKFDTAGNTYTYTIKELTINDQTPATAGYEVTERDLTITNKNVEKITVKVKKTWDGPKKDVDFSLYQGTPDTGTVVETKTLQSGDSELSFAPVSKYENGKLVDYYVKEGKLEGYKETEAQKVNSEKPEVTFANKNTEMATITVNKVWKNTPDEHKKAVEAVLYVEDLNDNQKMVEATPKQTVILTKDQLSGTFKAPKYDAAGNKRKYHVFEAKVGDTELNIEEQKDNKQQYQIAGENYQLTIDRGTDGQNFKVTLTNKNIQTTQVTVTKQWDGPTAKAKIALWKGTETIAVTEINGNQSFIFTQDKNGNSLPKRENGQVVSYGVKEVDQQDHALSDGEKITLNNRQYQIKIEPAGENQWKITNTFVSPKKEVKVRKDWVNTPNELKKNVKVQLYRKIEGETVATAVDPAQILELNANNNWAETFQNVDECDANDNPYSYSVKETLINGKAIDDSQYQVAYDEVQGTWVITNTNIETMTINVVKNWLGNDAAADGVSFKLLADDTESASLSLNKDTPKGSFTGSFPKYKAGELVQYTISEEKITGYKQVGDIKTDVNGNTITFTVTNSKLKDITIEKTWVGAAADRVNFGLYHGDKQIDTLTLTANDSKNGVWTNSFKDVYVYDENGRVIDYVVRELNQDGTPVLPAPTGLSKATLDGISYQVEMAVTGDVHKFTNTALNEIEVEKVWKGQIATGSAVTLALYDVKDPDITIRPIQLIKLPLANGNWATKLPNLPTNKADGEKIRYTVKEVLVNDVDEVTQIIQPNTMFKLDNTKYQLMESEGNGKFVFTNVQYLDITMKKEWDDKFPAILRKNVKLALYSFTDGTDDFTRLEEFILNDGNGWTQVKTDLPRWANGKYISYRVVEENINGQAILMPWDYQNIFRYKVFAIKIDPKDITATAEVTVTNGITEVKQPDDPNYRNLRVVKLWGTTAEEHQKAVKVELFVKNEQGNLESTGQTLILDQTNNWVAMFDNLPRFWADKVSADKLSTTMELPDEEVPAGAPKAEKTEKSAENVDDANESHTQTDNDSELISEENTGLSEESSTTIETTENSVAEEVTETESQNGGSTDLTEVAETPKAEEGQAEETSKIEEVQSEETSQTEEKQLGEAPKAEEGQAEEAPKADEGQTGEAPKTEDGQNEEAPKVQDSQELTIVKETLPLGKPVAKREIEYFVFETEIDGQSIPFVAKEGLADYHFGDYQIKITAESDTVYIENLHVDAIPDSEKININVTKDWTGANKIRIKDVEITLYVQAGDTLKQVVKEPLILGEANNFRGVFANLRKQNDAGEELKYYVFETKIGEDNLSITPTVDLKEYSFGAYRITIIDNGSSQVTVKNFFVEEPKEPYDPGKEEDDQDNPGKGEDDQKDKPLPDPSDNDQPKTSTETEKPKEETILEPIVPEGKPTDEVVKEETMEEETIPQGKTELPKTNGVAGSLFLLLGSGLMTMGLNLRKKKGKDL
ncbi:Cna B-type domain-containing protein [Clostridiales bacterium COT073_COT-073]|nr:Cna B-type domain-containing protein [Clostridiales bacterium COT073_COT-073]